MFWNSFFSIPFSKASIYKLPATIVQALNINRQNAKNNFLLRLISTCLMSINCLPYTLNKDQEPIKYLLYINKTNTEKTINKYKILPP